MPWEVNHNPSLQAVELSLTGAVSGEDLRDGTMQGIRRALELGVSRGLIDAGEQEQTASMLELLDMPALYEAEGLPRRIRIALVVPRRVELHEVAEFYETICLNRGWMVHRAASREEAIEWLTDRE